MIEYKWLDWEELKALDVVLESRNIPSLNELTSRAIGVYDNDQLVGFVVLQLFPMIGPMWLDPTYRGNGVADQLSDRMINFLESSDARGYIAVADSQFVEKICERVGMKKIASPVYMR